MPRPATTEPPIGRAAAEYVRSRYGAFRKPHRLVIDFDADGAVASIKLELPLGVAGAGVGENVFIPNGFQQGVLRSLEGVALRSDPLGRAVGDRRRLFRDPGGLPELVEHGLVEHHPRLGYYRPDAPPPEMLPDHPPA